MFLIFQNCEKMLSILKHHFFQYPDDKLVMTQERKKWKCIRRLSRSVWESHHKKCKDYFLSFFQSTSKNQWRSRKDIKGKTNAYFNGFLTLRHALRNWIENCWIEDMENHFSCTLLKPLKFWLPSFFVYFSMTIIKWRKFSWTEIPNSKITIR